MTIERGNLLDHPILSETIEYKPQPEMVANLISEDLAVTEYPAGIIPEPFRSVARISVSGGIFRHFGLREQTERQLLGEYRIASLQAFDTPECGREAASIYRILSDRTLKVARLVNRGNGWVLAESEQEWWKQWVGAAVYLEQDEFNHYQDEVDFCEQRSEYSAVYPVLEFYEITDNLPFFDPNSTTFRLR